jgi:alcohol dehydrogenase
LDPQHPKEWPVAPLTVDATASPSGLRLALRHTAPDGVCSSVGGLHRQVRFPLLECYAHNVTFHVGRSHPRTLIPEVLALMSNGRLHPEAVTTNVAALDDAPQALRDHCRTDAVKTILVQ